MTGENATTVGEICRRLDGIPLAIELAAARVDLFSLAEIRNRLDERFRILTQGRRTALSRQQTMRATIDWSYELLPPVEKSLFRRFSIFAGGCTLAAAEFTCSFGELESPNVLDALSSLVRKSLLVVVADPADTRYQMLESIQAYASQKAASERESLLERLTLWVSAFVERAATESSKVPQQTWLARIEREIGNIRVALDWSTTSEGHVGAAARILGRLAMFWHDAGKQGEGQRWIDRILPQMDEGAEPLLTGRLWRATAVNGVGSRAVSSSEKAIALLERAADRKDLARAYRTYAYALFQVARRQDADAAAKRAIELYETEQLRGSREYADTLTTRAIILRALGLDQQARGLFDAAIGIFEAIDDERGTALVRGNLAELEFVNGRVGQALQLASEAAETFRRLGATMREATALVNAATYNLELREIGAARVAARDALALAQRTEATSIISVAIQIIAAVLAFDGEAKRSAQLLGYVDEWYKSVGSEREWSEQRVADLTTSWLSTRASSGEIADLRRDGAALSQEEAVREALAD